MVKKTQKPIFSIILPTHNREDVVGFSIESVLNQTFKDFELLIIGDGCTDSTESIVREFVKRDKRVKWFDFQKGKGFGYEHRNTVLAKAVGDYIAFAAHDNLWFPDHFEFFVKYFQENPQYHIAYTRPLWMHPDGTLIPSSFNLGNKKSRNIFFGSHNEIPAHCVVHTRSSGEQVNFYNSALPRAADWDLWKRILDKYERRIGFIGVPTAIHFKAIWRSNNNFLTPAISTTHEAIKNSPEFSRVLKVAIQPGTPPQQIIWGSIKNKGGWLDEIRRNIESFLDLLVYDGLEAREANRHVLAENENLKKEILNMINSKGYKALQIIRRLARPLAK